MVTKGQFLERPTLIPVGKEVMEALAHRGDRRPPLLLIPPWPADGGGMDQAVASEIVWAAAMAGHPTLRFNFRGVGASQGLRGEGAALLTDVEAALRLTAENAKAKQVAVVTLGQAANTALALARQPSEVCALCFVSPWNLNLAELKQVGSECPLSIIMAETDERQSRPQLSQAVTEAGGILKIIPSADAAFTRNLSEVGKIVAAWLGQCHLSPP